MRKFTAISLFAGAGGLDMGFERAGFRTIWANDFNEDACRTHEKWSNAKVICGDIARIEAKDIPDADIMLGGFPCQGFSLSGPRKLDDSRNTLYRHYVRIVREKKPLMFVGENVKGLLTMGGGAIIDAILEDLQRLLPAFERKGLCRSGGQGAHHHRWIPEGFRRNGVRFSRSKRIQGDNR